MWTVIKEAPHKAKALFLVGVIFLFLAFANFSTYAELKEGRAETRYYRAQFILFNDLRVWAVFFGIAGVVALWASVVHKYNVGFFATMLMATWWAGLFVASLMMTGYPRIIPSILMWSLISIFLYIIASWPEWVTANELDKELDRLEKPYEK